jgi:hypothetical protein
MSFSGDQLLSKDILFSFVLIFVVMLVIEDRPLNDKLLRRELIIDTNISNLFHSAADSNTAQMLVQNSAHTHSFHNPTKRWGLLICGGKIFCKLYFDVAVGIAQPLQ